MCTNIGVHFWVCTGLLCVAKPVCVFNVCVYVCACPVGLCIRLSVSVCVVYLCVCHDVLFLHVLYISMCVTRVCVLCVSGCCISGYVCVICVSGECVWFLITLQAFPLLSSSVPHSPLRPDSQSDPHLPSPAPPAPDQAFCLLSSKHRTSGIKTQALESDRSRFQPWLCTCQLSDLD